jgi:putative transposase
MYHIIFIPKYRKKVMFGKLKYDIRDIIRKLCEYKNVEIKAGSISSDHVHLFVSIPAKLSLSEFMGYLKGRSALMICDMHPELREKKQDRHFWATGYYADTVGRNEEVIREYIQNQYKHDKTADQIK